MKAQKQIISVRLISGIVYKAEVIRFERKVGVNGSFVVKLLNCNDLVVVPINAVVG